MSRDDGREIDLTEERLAVGTETSAAGGVRARKRVEKLQEQRVAAAGVEHADLETAAPLEVEDGEVHVLEDGSVSVPVFEEQLVVTTRLVVRERVILRKHTVYDEHAITADLRREHLDIEADEAVSDRVKLT